MKILLLVLAQILGKSPMNTVDYKEVEFKDLPVVCKSEYNQYLFKERKSPNSNYVIYCDLDGDKRDEILSFDGNAGSGGMGWNVISKDRKIGDVFGSVAIVNNDKTNGLLIGHSIGYDETSWKYYELKNDKLEKLFEIEAIYFPPQKSQLKTKVKSLKINNKNK